MTEKKELRLSLRQQRDAIPAEGKKQLDRLICRAIAESAPFRQAETVLLYYPIGSEIDLTPLVSVCRRMGKEVGFPVCTEEGGLIFRSPAEGEQLVKGRHGIPVPAPEAKLSSLNGRTLCIVPGLSFTPNGARIGYGGGYYDRFLATFPGVSMGAVYQRLMRDALPTEPHDLPVGYTATEQGVSACAAFSARDLWKRALHRARNLAATVKSGLKRMAGTEPAAAKKEETSTADPIRPRVGAPLLVFVTYLLLGLSRLIDTALTRRGSEYIAVILLQLLIFVLPTVLYLQWKGEKLTTACRITPLRPEHLWFCACALVVMITAGLLMSILTGGIQSLEGNFTLYNTFVARTNGNLWEILYVILAYAVLPALCEEPVYRAVLCAEYESAGVGVAVTVSALFFAMLHFSIPLFLHYFVLGLILASVMYATRSAPAAMLLHFFYNLFCLFGQPYLSAFYVNAGSGEIFIFCLITLMLLFAAFGAGEARKIYYLYSRANLSSAYTSSIPLAEYPKRILRVLATPAIIPAFLTWLVMVIFSAVG
ncbi:MAG: 5-formyltetrahydrofolate cyclo-ligase [Ruminococcaceae bacterium]|nr:5-formyltetrahydrofolate cyclo-ligase [Oscillospiraceae bacterium]